MPERLIFQNTETGRIMENPFENIAEQLKVVDSSLNSSIVPIIPFENEECIYIKKLYNNSNHSKEVYICDLQDNIYAKSTQFNNKIFNIAFLSGKFGKVSSVLIPTDKEFEHLKLLAIEDSYLYAENIMELRIFGNFITNSIIAPVPFSGNQYSNSPIERLRELAISFQNVKSEKVFKNNTLLITTADSCMPLAVENAMESFFNDGLFDYIQPEGKFLHKITKDYNVFIPSAGKGTRLGDATWFVGNVSKPAIPLPAKIRGKKYLLVQDTLLNLSRAGVFGKETNIEIIREAEPTGSASGLIKALQKNLIDISKPLIVRQCDAFSDIDFTEALCHFENTNAAVMIIGQAVDKRMLSSVGIIGINNNMEIIDFIEKPGCPDKAAPGLLRNHPKYQDRYLGSIGMYLFSSETLKWMKKQIDENQDVYKGNDNLYDFAKNILPKLMKDCLNNKIKDSNNVAQKMIAFVAECNWSDFGLTKEYMCELRKSVAVPQEEGGYKIPEYIRRQFKKNINLKTGLICLPGSKKDFERFSNKYNLQTIGNILVTSTKVTQ